MRRLICLGVSAMVLVGVSGCSASAPSRDRAAKGTAIVATVAGTPISKQAVIHRMSILAFENHVSVADLQEGGPRYRTLQGQALSYLISTQWQIAEAAAEGTPVGAGAARLQVEHIEKRLFPSRARFESFLESSRKTVADLQLETEASSASAKIHERMAAGVPKLTAAEVAHYYIAHRGRYRIPQRRDLKILRTATAAEAVEAKREIGAGASFAELAGKSRIAQPIFAKEGLALGVVPNFYKEKPLNDAIFSARPDVLTGPVKIYLGYYIFEVKRVRRPHQESLAEARRTIEQQVPSERRERKQLQFIAAWRARWKAKTSCAPGYVVAKCRQYEGTVAEDPTALD